MAVGGHADRDSPDDGVANEGVLRVEQDRPPDRGRDVKVSLLAQRDAALSVVPMAYFVVHP